MELLKWWNVSDAWAPQWVVDLKGEKKKKQFQQLQLISTSNEAEEAEFRKKKKKCGGYEDGESAEMNAWIISLGVNWHHIGQAGQTDWVIPFGRKQHF